jgi:hypothetical protein
MKICLGRPARFLKIFIVAFLKGRVDSQGLVAGFVGWLNDICGERGS